MSENVRNYNIGASDYSKHKYQPWDIILEYKLDFFDGNILKYLLRKKGSDKEDYEKIIHYCQEKLRQIEMQRSEQTLKIPFNEQTGGCR